MVILGPLQSLPISIYFIVQSLTKVQTKKVFNKACQGKLNMKEFCFLCIQDFVMNKLYVNILLYTFKDFPNVTLHYMQIEKTFCVYFRVVSICSRCIYKYACN